MEQRFITAYIWAYGGTRKAARAVYRSASAEYVAQIISGFEQNAARAFNND